MGGKGRQRQGVHAWIPVRLEPRLPRAGRDADSLCRHWSLGHSPAVPLTRNQPPNRSHRRGRKAGRYTAVLFSVSPSYAYGNRAIGCMSITQVRSPRHFTTSKLPKRYLGHLTPHHSHIHLYGCAHHPARRPASQRLPSHSLQNDSSGERASEPVCEGSRASAVALGLFFQGLGKPLLNLLNPVVVLRLVNTPFTRKKQSAGGTACDLQRDGCSSIPGGRFAAVAPFFARSPGLAAGRNRPRPS